MESKKSKYKSGTEIEEAIRQKKEKKVAIKQKKVDRKKAVLEKRWQVLCQKFKFDLLNQPTDTIECLKSKFIKIKGNKLKAVQNVKNFRIYCRNFNLDFSLYNYLMKEYFVIDFKSKYPEIFISESTSKSKRSKKMNSISNHKSSIAENLNDEILEKLNELKNST